MEYLKGKDFVSDFAERTLANLEKIENDNTDLEKYEVTQLVNSFLGLIVFPKERSITDSHWNKLLKSNNVSSNPNGNCNYLRRMRNAISHSHILFECGNILDKNGKKQVVSITFVDCDFKDGKSPCKASNDCSKCRLKPKSPEKPNFVLTIPIDNLRSCIEAIATDLIKMKGSTTK